MIYVGVGNFSDTNYDLSLRIIGYNSNFNLFGADWGYYGTFSGSPYVDFLFIGI